MRMILVLLFLALLGTVSEGAGELRAIELTDGSAITAEVLSLANGIYTVRSDTLGTLKIEESRVRAIRSRSSRPAGAASGDVRALQERMMNDQEVMGLIQSLQKDPEFQKVLEDPALMNAVNSGDMVTLLANPKFMNLLNNATIRNIQKKVQ